MIHSDLDHDKAAARVQAVLASQPGLRLFTIGQMARAVIDADVDEATPDFLRSADPEQARAGWRDWLRGISASKRLGSHIAGWDAKHRPAIYSTRALA